MSLAALSEGPSRAAPPPWRPDPEAFIEAAARLAGAVAIVAGQDEAGAFGLLVSSLTVLSVEPPRLLFCVRKAASAHARLLAADRLSLTVLGEDHESEARVFAGREAAGERFAAERWTLSPGHPPHFHAGLLSVTGEAFQRIDADSHTVFILDAARTTIRESEPLLYYNRRFRRLALAETGAP